MSEKSTGAELPSQLDPLQLALKKVYSIHKEKIRELADEREEYKKGYDHLGQHKTRLLEKVRNLQNQNEILYRENTRLRNVLDDLRARDGRGSGKCQMCEHLQGSMSAIQEAYKHSLEEKEKMIHYLEERLSESNKQVSLSNLNLSNLLTPNTSFDGADSVLGKSPASTAKDKNGNTSTTAGSRTMKTVTQTHCTENRVDESAEKVSRRSSGRRGANLKRNECLDEADSAGREYSQKTSDKRHLEAGDTKTPHVIHCARSDATSSTLHSRTGREGSGQTMSVDEEGCRSDGSSDKESPESARLRRLHLGRKPGKRSRYTEDTVQENKKHKFDTSHVLNTSDESHGPPAWPPKQAQRSYHAHQSRVLVQETCDPDTDRTASMSSDGSPEKPSRTSLAEKCNNADFGVVPETLGMGLTSSESESDSDMDTQDTIRAKSVDGSPDNVLVSPPSDVDDKMEKVKQILDRRSRTVSDKKQQEEKAASRKDESRCDESILDHHKKGTRSSASVVVTKLALDDTNGKDMSPRPSSPVFSGVKGSRQSIESPFLFEEDRPDSSRSSSRRSANMSGMMSDQESPLLLKPVEAVAAYSNECGQSPSLKEAPRTSDVSGRRTQERNHTDSECLQAGRTSQERLQRTVHARNLRKAEKLKQTTLSQAFTPSPPGLPLNVSPTKPEERAAIDKAIRLSLQEIHGNTEDVRTKKSVFVRSDDKPCDAENVPPIFKRPPSPRSLRSPVKKTSPHKKSPHKQKSDRPSRTQHDHEDVIDLDETVAPDSASFDTFSNKGGSMDQTRKFPVHVLNESLDPDVSLTQYCSDTELLSQRPGLRRSLKRVSRKDLRSDQGPRLGSHSQGSQAASLDVGEETCYRTKAGNHNLHSNRTHTDPASRDAKSTFSKKKKDGRGSTPESGNEYVKDKLRTTKSSVPSFDSFNEGVSLDHDDYLADSGVNKSSAIVVSGSSKPSASVESEGPSLHTVDHEENEADVTLDPKFMKAHMFQAQIDIDSVQTDSDSIPLSSRSFKFGSSKSSKSGDSQGKEARIGDDEDELEEEEHTITPDGWGHRREPLNDSFDRVPRKQQADYAYVDVVRKKAERQQLKASSCQECYEYYKSKGCSEEEIQQQIQDCSRHRARYLPPSTPEHFWSIGFPDTQECEERGYIRVESPSKQKPGYRRRRKLTKRFKSRGEEENDSQTDTQK
ncbi:uncharacterized protein LOC124258729 [Haliotis rubra]|uniref:uncharacterized protein LOC124258729 n=1 Tax=Haliotis rubra TaxID=36100 RepID=UPI001EE577F7|nr:uncharacterized protein LOC124258729 [Haliotis rubra]